LVPGALLGAYQVGVVRKYEWDMDDRLLEKPSATKTRYLL